MQVVSRGIPRAAYIPNNLPCRHGFARRDGCCCHVGVPRGQARAIIQQNLIAVAVVPTTDQHRAAVSSQDGRAFRRGNIRAAMPGIAESVHLSEVRGQHGMSRQRPEQRSVPGGRGAGASTKARTAQSYQHGTHLVGKQQVQNIALILREVVVRGQRIDRFAANGDRRSKS